MPLPTPSTPKCCTTPAVAPPIRVQEDQEFAALAQALAHPARVRILRFLLAQKECLAGDLQAEVGLSAATVSQHLKRLKETGWVRGEVDGPRRCYCLNPETRDRFHSLVEGLL